ncbi:hypothetical protein [Candidatus Palauibacter sp.]|uniref:hypothetical protein n=1 Tax=Candidatus Palauibacter sp. TaxID=3101350 RepID=UPI003C6F7FDE
MERHRPAAGFADGVARRIELAGAALDRELGRLPGWLPAPGFASAVLARVRLPVPWPERLLRFARRRRAALATAGTATLSVSAGVAAWLFGVGGFAPGQLLAFTLDGARAVLVDAALAAGRVGYRLGLVDAGGSVLDRISPAAALTSLALSGLAGMASLWVMTALFRRPARQPVRLRGTAGVVPLVALLACFPGPLPASAQEVEIADAVITLSAGGRAELWFELEDGTEHRLRFEGETIELDGAVIGSYGDPGTIVVGWREFLREHAGEDGARVREGLRGFRALLAQWSTVQTGSERDAARALGLRLEEILEPAVEAPAVARTDEGETGLRPGSLQIVPGGLGFDVGDRLERLRDALRRLGAAGESVEGDLAMIVHGDYRIPAETTITGDIAILDGTLSLAGAVEGDALLLDGTLLLVDAARVEGDVLRVGGELLFRGETATIGGEILSDIALAAPDPATEVAPQSPPGPAAEVVAGSARQRARGPGPGSLFLRNLGNAAEGLIGAISTLVGLVVLGLLLVYFARSRIETVSDTVRREFARSFAMGLAGQILFFPALLVLIVLVITWPVVPFFVLTVGLAGLAGYVAVAHGAGEMFARRRYRYAWMEGLRRSNSYYYVGSGLILLILPFAAGALLWVFGGAAGFVRGLIFFVAGLGTWVLVTAGFGGVLLTRAGSRSVVIDWSAGAEPGDVGIEVDVADEPSGPAPDA